MRVLSDSPRSWVIHTGESYQLLDRSQTESTFSWQLEMQIKYELSIELTYEGGNEETKTKPTS